MGDNRLTYEPEYLMGVTRFAHHERSLVSLGFSSKGTAMILKARGCLLFKGECQALQLLEV